MIKELNVLGNNYNVVFNECTSKLTCGSSGGSGYCGNWVEKITPIGCSSSNGGCGISSPNYGHSCGSGTGLCSSGCGSSGCSSSVFNKSVYVLLNTSCNAKCDFCCNKSSKNELFNTDIFISTIMKLGNFVKSVAITGGEPLIRIFKLADLSEKLSMLKIHHGITTNGILLSKYIGVLNTFPLNYINISRHSINDDKNNEIFGVKTPGLDELKQIVTKLKHPVRINYTITEDNFNLSEVVKKLNFVDSILFRKEYYKGKTQEVTGDIINGEKCRCILNDNFNIPVSYREVSNEREIQLEEQGNIVNLVYKNNTLYGGWSDKAIKII